ncbi:MAG: M3 family metallopeptidase [Gammaproteobacteria bacterium]|nr:M3 family metallopeptidase [Gammaproteobacteria bacterium]
MQTDNPLLAPFELPPFGVIRPEHIVPAITSLLDEARTTIAQLLVTVTAPTWANLMEPLAELDDRLTRAWSPVEHLNAVVNTEELRAAHDACLPPITTYYTELGQNPVLYRLLQRLAASDTGLDAAQRKAIDDRLLAFRLAGAELDELARQRLLAIQTELASLGAQFQQNVLQATDAFSRRYDSVAPLAGLPESALAQAAQAAAGDGWLLTLQAPSYLAVMTHAADRTLRREFYLAYQTRAAATGPHDPRWDNTPLIERILALRQELAGLLGFANYAALSLATKMATSPDQVLGFLDDLALRSVPAAQAELRDLVEFATADLGGAPLEPWDLAYYAEKLRRQRFDLSQEALKPWFPLERVLTGMFAIVRRIYGVEVTPLDGVDTGHADARCYQIHDVHGALRGRFYLDPYARVRKRGGAWMHHLRNRRRIGAHLQLPAAFLVCNFTPPLGEVPALLTHNEVTTLFHEFGHGLHHLLTRIDYPEVSGINGVEWDAVELPSQFMENWCWQPEALALISGHHATGAPLPATEIAKLRAAKNFHAALQMVRQLEFGLFDMQLHMRLPAPDGAGVEQLISAIRERLKVLRPPAAVRFQNGFSHIFAGGYAAGYYSYKWAEVLSADAFASFREEGVFNPDTGRRFLQEILERGGSRKALDSFVAFKGREPRVEALLQDAGLRVA